MNLTTARASRRAKEVGIRKTIGSTRGKLVTQFLIESVIMTTLAMMLSLVLAQIFLDVFKMITGEILVNALWLNNWSLVILFAFTLCVGILSGIYPAFYLTSFRPAKVLKRKSFGRGNNLP